MHFTRFFIFWFLRTQKSKINSFTFSYFSFDKPRTLNTECQTHKVPRLFYKRKVKMFLYFFKYILQSTNNCSQCIFYILLAYYYYGTGVIYLCIRYEFIDKPGIWYNNYILPLYRRLRRCTSEHSLSKNSEKYEICFCDWIYRKSITRTFGPVRWQILCFFSTRLVVKMFNLIVANGQKRTNLKVSFANNLPQRRTP